MENLIDLKANWNEIIWKLKKTFTRLAVSDLVYIEGRQDELFDTLRAQFGKTNKEMHDLISSL